MEAVNNVSCRVGKPQALFDIDNEASCILEALTFQGCRAGKVKTKERQGGCQRISP